MGGLSAFAALKLKTKPINLSVMGIYGENASDMMMLGGYAVERITDPVTQLKEWTTLNNAGFWADLSTNGTRVVAGLFTGYSKNIGSRETIRGTAYSRGNDIDHLFRVSPRLTFTDGKLSIATELEGTLAAYGTMEDDGRVSDTHNVTNVRLLVSLIYRF